MLEEQEVKRLQAIALSLISTAAEMDSWAVPRSTVYMLCDMDMSLTERVEYVLQRLGWASFTRSTMRFTEAGIKKGLELNAKLAEEGIAL